ncbi:MAG TPA: hypothetical protein VLH35_08015 [Candidatus Acidoferrales bacterium]|nr:hypothetical protein [Candidatus Acidoferrales bacterium]
MPEPTDEQIESVFEKVVLVRYIDHVMYNRTSALSMQPQVREAVGWLIYEAETYIIISYDRDAGPPTLHGGDPKASGLVLLKSDIMRMVAFSPELNLKSKHDKQEPEYAFRPTERKTLKRAKSSKGEN